jgi:hypothetical protein
MRLVGLPVLCTVVVFSGCASRAPVSERAPATAVEPVAIAKTNRFDMRQDGRSMSAEDFDAWMRVRGIRIAKGASVAAAAAKAPSKNTATKSVKP